MSSQGICSVTVDNMTFGVDIVPVEIGRPNNRLALFEGIGTFMIRLLQREKLTGRFLRQRILGGGYRTGQTQKQY
jgi:hypothetical protein